MKNNSQKLFDLGQSIWYDNIERRLLDNGELAQMVADGKIYGVTSNPSIFNNAIAKSSAYDEQLIPLAKDGKTPLEIFEALAVDDIRRATDLFAELYKETAGGDGYVSLEVNPDLAHKTEETLKEAKRLWKLVDRKNLMVKIPATEAGIPAIRQAIAAGINVNVTLIFSVERYKKVMDAYLAGLEDRLKTGGEIGQIASVASFFVSRMDTKVDGRLQAIVEQGSAGVEKAKGLMGKAAIANARLAYQEYKNIFESERFMKLEAAGARIQRPLWASTSTKNPAYSEVLYVDELIGPNTVNTVPPNTLDALLVQSKIALTLEDDLEQQAQVLADLESLGISVAQVTKELEDEGVASFSNAFASMLNTIQERSEKIHQQL